MFSDRILFSHECVRKDVKFCMKIILICTFIMASFSSFAEKPKKDFSLKKIVEDKKQFSQLVEKTIISGNVDSREKAYELVDRATASLPVHSHIQKNPIYGEVLYQTSKKPDALVGIISIFLEKTKLVQFFLLLVGSLYLSSLMGEAKYFMKPFGMGRIMYGVFRFGLINSIRLGGFVYLFKANLAPFGQVIVSSVTQVAADYPVLVKSSHLLHNLLTTTLSF